MNDKPIIVSGPMVRALLDGRKTQTRRVLKPQPPENARYSGIHFASDEPDSHFFNTPQGPFKTRQRIAEGDRLWVRETFKEAHPIAFPNGRKGRRLLSAGIPGPPGVDYLVAYRADGELLPYWHSSSFPYRQLEPRDELDRTHFPNGVETGWSSPIHMPCRASRLTLIVTDVRVQRVQEISLGDALAEGVEMESADPPFYYVPGFFPHSITAVGIEEGGGRHAERSFAKLWNHLNASRGYGWDANPWVVALTFTVQRGNIDEAAP